MTAKDDRKPVSNITIAPSSKHIGFRWREGDLEERLSLPLPIRLAFFLLHCRSIPAHMPTRGEAHGRRHGKHASSLLDMLTLLPVWVWPVLHSQHLLLCPSSSSSSTSYARSSAWRVQWVRTLVWLWPWPIFLAFIGIFTLTESHSSLCEWLACRDY